MHYSPFAVLSSFEEFSLLYCKAFLLLLKKIISIIVCNMDNK